MFHYNFQLIHESLVKPAGSLQSFTGSIANLKILDSTSISFNEQISHIPDHYKMEYYAGFNATTSWRMCS